MNRTPEAFKEKSTPFGLPLAFIAGVLAAALGGYAYYFIAVHLDFDFVIAFAALLGAGVGWMVGLVARVGGLRSSLVVILIGFVFGVAGYAGRYFFEFNAFVNVIVHEQAPPGMSADEAQNAFLEFWAEEYPSGGLAGYLRYTAETGFTLGDQLSFDPETMTASRGTHTADVMVWSLLGLETLFAGILAADMARTTAIGPIGA